MNGVTIQLGLPATLRPAAARLYWQAFGGKLGLVMGPESRALRYLEQVINPDQAFVALNPAGELVGIAGFKTPEGSFAGGSKPEMVAHYGRIGGWWRMVLLTRLSREIDNERFLLDGICVDPRQRGKGVGSALMQAICDEALRRGYAAVRLDVINTNWRAKALYARLGFQEEKSRSIVLLRYAFGFASSTTMVRRSGPR